MSSEQQRQERIRLELERMDLPDREDPHFEELDKRGDEIAAQILELDRLIHKNPTHEARRNQRASLMKEYNQIFEEKIAHLYDPNNSAYCIEPLSGNSTLFMGCKTLLQGFSEN